MQRMNLFVLYFIWLECSLISSFFAPDFVLLDKKFANIEMAIIWGRVMAHVASRRPLTAEARVRARVNPCGICGRQSGTGTGFSLSSSVFPCQYIIPPSLSKLISSGECVIC
jgi:hypothetical protein